MQPRDIIATAIESVYADDWTLETADVIIEALGREGWEVVQRRWKSRDGAWFYHQPPEYAVTPTVFA